MAKKKRKSKKSPMSMLKRALRKGKSKKKHRGGHVPLPILKRRLAKLSKIVASRS